jgi:hypothetical protein
MSAPLQWTRAGAILLSPVILQGRPPKGLPGRSHGTHAWSAKPGCAYPQPRSNRSKIDVLSKGVGTQSLTRFSVGPPIHELNDKTERQRDRQTKRQTGRQADRQADRRAGRQTDRQADRQEFAKRHVTKPVLGASMVLSTHRQTDRQIARISPRRGTFIYLCEFAPRHVTKIVLGTLMELSTPASE